MKETIEVTNRRTFLTGATALAFNFNPRMRAQADKESPSALVSRQDRARILAAADAYLKVEPLTVTSIPAPNSPGGPHDFVSLADYYWPDPKNPGGIYISLDGKSNPENFDGHRKLMVDLSLIVPALTCAWLITSDMRYAKRAVDHLRAWFVTPDTRMTPNLKFGQGIVGGVSGRSSGIIDSLHLVEVARSAKLLRDSVMTSYDRSALLNWFSEYLTWMKESRMGQGERDTPNNHATCWALQASEYARLLDDHQTRTEIHQWYRTVLIPNQFGKDGSFPKELIRTKPYNYSIFNFDVSVCLAQSLLGVGVDLRKFRLSDGRGLEKAAAFIYPYLADKAAWPYPHDIEGFENLPLRSPGLLFIGIAEEQSAYVTLWKRLNPDPTNREALRNFPVRQPLLWV